MGLVSRLVLLKFVVLAPVLAGMICGLAWLRDAREREVSAKAQQLSALITGEQKSFIANLDAIISAASIEAPQLVSRREACSSFKARFDPHFSWLQLLFFDSKGVMRCSTGQEATGTDDAGSPDITKVGDRLTVEEIKSGPFQEHPVLTSTLGWRNPDGNHGAINAIVRLDVAPLIRNIAALPENAVAVLVDRAGRIITSLPAAATRNGEGLPLSLTPLLNTTSPGTIRLQWLDGSDQVVAYDFSSQPVIPGIFVLAGVSYTTAMASISTLQHLAWVILGISVVAAIAVAWWGTRRFIRQPIGILTKTIERWRDGDHSARARLPGESEFALLGRLCDEMAEATERSESETRAYAECLRKAKEVAEAANRAKTRFLAAASHDLRQPLQGAILLADLMSKGLSDETLRPYADQLDASLGDLQSMLDSLFEVSQFDASNVKPSVTRFPLQPLLERVAANCQVSARAKGLELAILPSAISVRSDRALLGRMLNNLVGNAVRYTSHGSVKIECSRISDVVRVAVRDTGSGIAASDLGRIWHEFEQLHHNEGRDRRKGLGLGLAIVRRMSEILDHPVNVTSEPGRGSCFSVDVPVAQDGEDRSERDESAQAVPTFSGDNRLAVVIEDDPTLLEALCQTLQFRNWMVVGSSGGEQALTQLRKLDARPHLILTDYRLAAGETGAHVIRAIRGLTGLRVPAIILTGEIVSDSPEADLPSRDAAELEDVVVMRKPVRSGSIMRVIQDLMARPGLSSRVVPEPVLCVGD